MILVGGENLVDLVQTGMRDGEPVFEGHAGGSCYNCAMAMGRQGIKTGYLTPISSDTLGDKLARTLEDSDVELLADRVAAPTSLAVVTLDNGQPSYQFYRNGTAERLVQKMQIDAAAANSPVAFHIGSLALIDGADADLWADTFIEMKQQGVLTSLDPNIRAMLVADREEYAERLARLMPHADVLKLSDEDLEWMYPGQSLDDAFQSILKDSNAGLTVLTMGSKGCRAKTNTSEMEIPAAPVSDLKDTIGAGDTFMATILSGLHRLDAMDRSTIDGLNEVQVRTLLERAAKAAALNCQQVGCNPPTAEELDGA